MNRCPKCDAELRPGASACGACGLAAERFEGFQSDPAYGPPEVVAGWQACLDTWDDDGAHERFRALAAATGAFAFAARSYRQAARERPGDERAQAGLARVQRMAEAALLTRPKEPEGTGPVGRRRQNTAALALVVLLLLAALGAVAALMMRTAHRETEPRQSPPSQGRSRAPVVE